MAELQEHAWQEIREGSYRMKKRVEWLKSQFDRELAGKDEWAQLDYLQSVMLYALERYPHSREEAHLLAAGLAAYLHDKEQGRPSNPGDDPDIDPPGIWDLFKGVKEKLENILELLGKAR